MTETQRKIANLLQFLDRVPLEGREVPAFTEATAWLGEQHSADGEDQPMFTPSADDAAAG